MTPVTNYRRPTVLVVEDDEGVARMLRFCFREAGFDATEASTGGAALEILKRTPLDAAVLDLQLPNGQGGAVLEWLRQIGEQASTSPVWIVISALDQDEATKRYGCLGSQFLAKPFDPWRLVAMLKELLSAKS